jgi:hypothetical protein
MPDRHSQDQAGRTTFERATAGYDQQFADFLTAEIVAAITKASVIEHDGVRIMCLRTGETIDACVNVLVTFMSMCQAHDVPSKLRTNVETIAKRIRRQVARARAEGAADILGGAKGGTA